MNTIKQQQRRLQVDVIILSLAYGEVPKNSTHLQRPKSTKTEQKNQTMICHFLYPNRIITKQNRQATTNELKHTKRDREREGGRNVTQRKKKQTSRTIKKGFFYVQYEQSATLAMPIVYIHFVLFFDNY